MVSLALDLPWDSDVLKDSLRLLDVPTDRSVFVRRFPPLSDPLLGLVRDHSSPGPSSSHGTPSRIPHPFDRDRPASFFHRRLATRDRLHPGGVTSPVCGTDRFGCSGSTRDSTELRVRRTADWSTPDGTVGEGRRVVETWFKRFKVVVHLYPSVAHRRTADDRLSDDLAPVSRPGYQAVSVVLDVTHGLPGPVVPQTPFLDPSVPGLTILSYRTTLPV